MDEYSLEGLMRKSFILIPFICLMSFSLFAGPKYNSLVILNSTTNLETDFKIDTVEMKLTQKGFNLKISGKTTIDDEIKTGTCVIQSFKGEIILPIYQAIYKNFNSTGPKDMKVICSAKSIEGPAVILLDMGQGDLTIGHY